MQTVISGILIFSMGIKYLGGNQIETFTLTYAHIHTETHTQTCTHTHTQAHTHTHMHKKTPIRRLAVGSSLLQFI